MNNNKNYDILIVSEDYPGNGGFGTYAFNLFIHMAEKKFKIALLYFSKHAELKIESPNENIYYIHIPNFNCSINMISDGTYHSSIIENNIISKLIAYRLNKIKIVISISPSSMFLVNKYIEVQKHIYRIGHIHYNKLSNINDLWKLDNKNIGTMLRENYISDKILKDDPRIIVIPNSPLAEIFINTLKKNMGLKNKIHHNMIGLSYNFTNITISEPKKYDIIFIVSNVFRKEKNFILAKRIFDKCPNYKKIIVGHNSKIYQAMFTNTKIYEFLPNDKLLKKIAKTKVLILPSFIDAGPNVIIESIIYGTIPIMSLNTGFASLFSNKYICQTNNDTEWIEKINNILKNYKKIVFNKEFSGIINKISEDKNKFFELISSLLLECKLIDYCNDPKNIQKKETDTEIILVDQKNGYDNIQMVPINKNQLKNLK